MCMIVTLLYVLRQVKVHRCSSSSCNSEQGWPTFSLCHVCLRVIDVISRWGKEPSACLLPNWGRVPVHKGKQRQGGGGNCLDTTQWMRTLPVPTPTTADYIRPPPLSRLPHKLAASLPCRGAENNTQSRDNRVWLPLRCLRRISWALIAKWLQAVKTCMQTTTDLHNKSHRPHYSYLLCIFNI